MDADAAEVAGGEVVAEVGFMRLGRDEEVVEDAGDRVIVFTLLDVGSTLGKERRVAADSGAECGFMLGGGGPDGCLLVGLPLAGRNGEVVSEEVEGDVGEGLCVDRARQAAVVVVHKKEEVGERMTDAREEGL